MRRNFSGARFENLDEPTPLDLSRDPADNMKDLLNQISSKEMMSTTKRMGYINNFTKLIQNVGENANFGYSLEDIIKCLMPPLVSAAKELRAAGLRAFRHLFYDEKTLSKILEYRIDIFIVRSMDMVHNAFEVERVQALRFIRKIIAVSPHLCPMSMAATLVSIGNDEGDDADRLRKACVATLCELAIKSIQTASYCGGINTIIRNVLDSQMQRFNESLMATLLYLLNNPESRLYVRSDVGLESVLAPFTDLHYRHNPDTPETHLREDKASRLQASKMAIVTIFRSWSGVISLCRPDGKGVQSLLGVFCLPNSDVRKGIMDIVFEIFQLKEPDWTDDFNIALLSVDPCQMQDAWKLSEGFVAEEAKALLPHRATGRTNLVKNYIALVLAAFMNAGLFESLVEVITSSDPFLSVRATILLGELLHLANTLLPPECSSHTHCVPILVNTASLFEVTIEERSRASIAVNCLDRLHQTKKRGLVPCSLYLSRIVSKAHTLEPKVKDKLHRDRLKACLNKEIDDPLFSSLRDTQVLMERDFRNWDWHLISSTLQSPTVTMRKLEETSNQKFIRNLLYFYKPSSQRFCIVHISDPQARTFSEVGCLLIDFLLDGEDVAEGLLLHDLVQDIGECLQEVLLQHSKALSPSITTGVLSNNNVLSTLSRDYFLFLGKLAGTKVGSKLLERTGVYQYLLELCSIPSRDSLQKLIVASLDYSHTGIPRIILSKILTASSSATRLYATSHMRVLLRARVAFFHSWGIELLVTQLYDTDNQVAVEAADVLDEACEDEANLQYLIELSPVLLHLGEVGHRLLTRFVSVESGLKYLTQRGYLTVLMDNWRREYNTAYVRWVEELLAESLTSYVKKSDDNTYLRRSNRRLVLKDAFLPPHLYGQLVQKKNGFKLLQKSNDVELFVRTLQTLEPKTKEQVDELKAALWALGHVGSTNWGINFLVEEGIIPEIVRLAVDCANFAIRGTCYYVLGLIAKTREGADILREYEWESVRHMGEDKWPVLETSLENKEEFVPISYIMEPQSKPVPSVLSGISETERAGGIYLGEESKAAEGSTAYDKFSGIYLGEDKGPSRKTSIEEASEGGILSLWYKNAERRRKIASRESGFYDERSGVYLGEESPSVSEPADEGVITPAPGGILERLFTETGLDLSSVNKEIKISHRRNYSEGNFSVATFGEKDSTFETLDVKRRAVSNVDRIGSPLKSVSEHSVDDVRVSNGIGLRPFHKHTASAPSEHVPQMDGTMSDGNRTNRGSVSESITFSALKPEMRNRTDSEVTDMSSLHMRSGSNLSSASVDSGDFLEMSYIASRSRTSSASETGGYLQQESPTSQSLLSVNSDDTSKTLGDKDPPLDSSADSLQGGLSFESLSAYSSNELLRRSSSPITEDRKRLPINDLLQNDLELRQRSTSLTEKRRMGSPSLGIIPETRSSSFSGSTDFTKVANKSRASSDAELIHVSPVENLNDLHGSNRSLAEVKILSDKTIVFRSGVESKTRALSVDSASSSGLRRDRLLVNSGQMSGDESDGNVSRSRGSSFEKADFARKLGLKSGDLSRVRRTRSTSSGNSSTEGFSPKKIVNKNRLLGSNENNTVISGDMRRNSSASSEASLFTSSRDAFGYTALSTLRRQRSFNRDLEKKVNAFGTTRTGTFQFPRSMSAGEFSSTKRDSLASIPSALEFRQFKSTNKNIGNEFLGLCLPRDLSLLFQTEPYEFQGSWADHFVATPTLLPPFVVNPTQRESHSSHDKSRCLGCMYTKSVGTGRDTTKSSDNMTDGEWTKLPPVMEANGESVNSAVAFSFAKSSDSSVTATSMLAKCSKLDENTTEGKRLFRAEILRIVTSLSSVVASRAHQEELMKLREKCALLFQDLCLYCEVSDILALYKFKLHIRRFIQGLFANVNFDPIIEQADLVLGREQSDSSA